MILSILICSITERQHLLDILQSKLQDQILMGGYVGKTEVLVNQDNREKPIGQKRQELLEYSKAKWICFLDDDDMPYPNYVELIMNAIASDKEADCIGTNGLMTINGEGRKRWCHRLGWLQAENYKGFHYTRGIWHFSPVLRTKALKAGFNVTMRYGEDADYASRLNPLLRKEVNIEPPLFVYRYSNKVPHSVKYGLNKDK